MQIVSRQFAWNVKSCFLGKITKNIINLSSAENAQRVVKVNSFYCSIWSNNALDFFLHNLVATWEKMSSWGWGGVGGMQTVESQISQRTYIIWSGTMLYFVIIYSTQWFYNRTGKVLVWSGLSLSAYARRPGFAWRNPIYAARWNDRNEPQD